MCTLYSLRAIRETTAQVILRQKTVQTVWTEDWLSMQYNYIACDHVHKTAYIWGFITELKDEVFWLTYMSLRTWTHQLQQTLNCSTSHFFKVNSSSCSPCSLELSDHEAHTSFSSPNNGLIIPACLTQLALEAGHKDINHMISRNRLAGLQAIMQREIWNTYHSEDQFIEIICLIFRDARWCGKEYQSNLLRFALAFEEALRLHL